MAKIALIGLLGVGAQWVAWRTNRPAIALMLVAGILAGPVLGLIDPARDFGAWQQPIIKLAVAVILFEGGLSLKFRELRRAGGAVLRLVLIGVPIGWGLGTAAAHYGAGLSLPVSALFGGILVVTGPTVIGPMLRTLSVPPRVRDVLKWEGIVNDPIGALLAVAIYAYITYKGPDIAAGAIALDVLGATAVAAGLGVLLGFGLTTLLRRGQVPEYLKAPILLVTVICGFVLADIVKHETGLITVTVMGVVMANRPTYSSTALRRFKEDLAVLLVSGVFVILSATLDWPTLERFQSRFVIFLLVLLFVVRPVTVLVSLAFSRVPWRERLFLAWVAPRGIVAVAVTGLFALRLADLGIGDADALVPLSFGVVVATIFAHGFTAGWLARRLGLDSGAGEGVLLVGANAFTAELAVALKAWGLPVLVADQSKFALRGVRKRELDVFLGDILDEEAAHDRIDLGAYQQVIAATDNDAYNALICTDLGPEKGFEHLALTGFDRERKAKARAQVLFESGATIEELIGRVAEGWTFSRTRLSEKFDYEAYRAQLPPGAEPLATLTPDLQLALFSTRAAAPVEPGHSILSFFPPEADAPPAAAPAGPARLP